MKLNETEKLKFNTNKKILFKGEIGDYNKLVIDGLTIANNNVERMLVNQGKSSREEFLINMENKYYSSILQEKYPLDVEKMEYELNIIYLKIKSTNAVELGFMYNNLKSSIEIYKNSNAFDTLHLGSEIRKKIIIIELLLELKPNFYLEIERLFGKMSNSIINKNYNNFEFCMPKQKVAVKR